MIKKLLPIFISALLPMTAFAETTIGVAMAHFDDNFLTQVREAIADQAQKQKDVKVKFSDAQGDASLQQTQVEKFVAQKMSAIIVNPADVAVSGKLIDTAHAAGIPIVFVKRKPDG